MDLVTLTRILCLIGWGAVLLYCTPAVLSLLFGESRYGDPARLVCWFFSLLTISFCARWFIAPDSADLFAALYVFGTVLALFTILAAKSYGRDGRP